MSATASVAVFDGVIKDYATGLLGRSTLRAVDQISLELKRGEVLALVGPNRAGKSTLVKLLLSLCRPTHGRIERLGEPTTRRSTLARVGYVHEHQAFPRNLSAQAVLEYYGALSLMPEAQVRARVPVLLELTGLSDRSSEPIARFSKGMCQRLAIAQALINDPELLVFDEPNEGLDLPGRQLLRDVIAQKRREGRSVLYVSHVLEEVEQVCDRIAVVVGGRLAYHGSFDELKRDSATGAPRPLSARLQELYGPATRN